MMFSTHSMKYIWYSPQKSKYPLFLYFYSCSKHRFWVPLFLCRLGMNLIFALLVLVQLSLCCTATSREMQSHSAIGTTTLVGFHQPRPTSNLLSELFSVKYREEQRTALERLYSALFLRPIVYFRVVIKESITR